MRVALASVDNPYIIKSGGKHVHLYLLEKGLQYNGVYVDTYYYVPSKIAFITKIFKRFRNKYYQFKSAIDKMIKFYEKINFNSYEIVNAHDVISAVGIKGNIILTLHGYFARETINYGNYNEKEKTKIFDYAMEIEKLALKKAKAIIKVDSRLRDYVINSFNIPENRIFVIYNSIDTENFKPINEQKKKELRMRKGIPPDKCVILIPRRYVKKNGVVFAAKALRLMDDNDLLMIFIGRGPERENIINELGSDKRAIVLDAVPHEQIVEYYQLADIILVPSVISDDIEEATSLSMLEGMACGKVVICSNIGGMREVVKNGQTGILVPQKSPEDIAKAIRDIKRNSELRVEIGYNARKYVEENHGYISHAKKFIQIYKYFINH
ncbi:MAG: glycosyl transferase [Dictyoglomus sp. NZ13-RE01]|nr:MAG: glycosyl transferase [Dictyoglomus sp. NZ13-RE01]